MQQINNNELCALVKITFTVTRRNKIKIHFVKLLKFIYIIVRQCYGGFYCIYNPEGWAVESEHSEDATRDLRDFKCRRI